MPAFAIGAALLAGVVRRPHARRAAARVWEGGGGEAERRVGRDASLQSDEDKTDEEEIDEG